MEENQNSGAHWSTKLGLFTGPLLICLGCLAIYIKGKSPISYALIFFGLFRFGMSLALYLKTKNKDK